MITKPSAHGSWQDITVRVQPYPAPAPRRGEGFVRQQSCITLSLMALIRILLVAVLAAHGPVAAQSLAGPDGARVRLGDFVGQGRWVMVNVWSPGCPHCLTELPALTNFHASNAAGATVLGLAVDYPGFGPVDPDELAAITGAHAINFPVIATDGDNAARFLGETVDLVPVTYAYDPHGRLVARWHGVITESDIDEIIRDFSTTAP